MKRFFFIFLGGALVGLVWLDILMWFDENGHLKNSSWAAPDPLIFDIAGQLTPLPTEGSIGNVAFLSVTERPLFSRTRRPPLPPPPPPPPPTPVAPDIFSNALVKGVLNYPGGSGVIIEMSGKSRRIRTGESVDGWQLSRVEGSSAVFTSGDARRSIPLSRAASLKGGGVPVSPPLGTVPQIVPTVPSVGATNPSGAGEIVPPSATGKKSRFGP